MSLPRAEPVFFGREERPLFGWLHRPASEPTTSLCLVLCNPFGYEAICSHRSLRHVAEAAAAVGVPTLRFDYDGSGDSAGSDLDPDRVRAWIDSVHTAVETARTELNCQRCCLLGIRLGATIAALASSERDDIEGLIAIAPIVNAKAYTRELRAVQIATGLPTAPTDNDDPNSMEATGFVLTGQTRETLAAINLLTQAPPPARSVLILDRDDLPGSERWAERLEGQQVRVERCEVPGYVEMMLTPHSSIVPREMIGLATDWLQRKAQALPATPAPSRHSEAVRTSGIRRSTTLAVGSGGPLPVMETLEFIDRDQRLFAVLDAPSSRINLCGRKGILLLNAGATHHVGPNRMHVLLARELAALGHVVLRLDISGIGDSPPRPGEPENIVYPAHAAEDLLTATRFLRQRTGVTECYALGLCSGAYHAFKAAVAGVPLDALVLINPLTFFWKEGMSLDAKMSTQRVLSEAQRYQQNVFQLQSWLKLLRGGVDLRKVAQVVSRRTLAAIRHRVRDLARRLRLPLSDDLGKELELVARLGVAMLFVFADSDPGMELLRIEGGSAVDKLARRRKLEIEVLDEADHTFTPRHARERLLSLLIARLQRLPAS